MKLVIEVQPVKVRSGQSLANRPVASLAIRRATGGCRSVDSEEVSREDRTPKSAIVVEASFRPLGPDGAADAVEAAGRQHRAVAMRDRIPNHRSLQPGARFQRDFPGTCENLDISLANKPGQVRPETVGSGFEAVRMHRPKSKYERPREGTGCQGNRGDRNGCEESYDPSVPRKVGNGS